MNGSTSQSAVVLGVGASKGLGAALCRRFALGGFHVLVAGRTEEKITAVANEIKAVGGEATAQVCDATSEENIISLFDKAESIRDGLGAAVYNAGNNNRKPILEMSAAWFEDTWRVACYGGFLFGREAAGRLLPRGYGSVLFTGATASMRGKPPFTAFASAKAGLRIFAQAMAREFGPSGIHVGHVVIDGGINGDILNNRRPEAISERGEDGLLDIDAIADCFWQLHEQQRTAWTFEIDLRPYKEPF